MGADIQCCIGEENEGHKTICNLAQKSLIAQMNKTEPPQKIERINPNLSLQHNCTNTEFVSDTKNEQEPISASNMEYRDQIPNNSQCCSSEETSNDFEMVKIDPVIYGQL